MAITTYAELKTAVANWLIRSDLTSRIPEFIALAEADINAKFEHRDIASSSTLTPVVGSRYITLPTGYRSPQQLWGQWVDSGGTFDLRPLTPETMAPSSVNSIPSAWCVDGDNIAFDCPNTSATDYTFLFRWLGGVALAESADTNLILENYPNVYLFGALKEGFAYARDADMAPYWGDRYANALADARAKENRDKALTTLSTEPGLLTMSRPSFDVYTGS